MQGRRILLVGYQESDRDLWRSRRRTSGSILCEDLTWGKGGYDRGSGQTPAAPVMHEAAQLHTSSSDVDMY